MNTHSSKYTVLRFLGKLSSQTDSQPSAHLLSRFDTIVVLDNGIVTHQSTYEELLAEGVVQETASDGNESLGSDLKGASDVVLMPPNPEKGDIEEGSDRAPSEWNVYGYFLKSCGVLGMCIFFAIAGSIAAMRSFESKSRALPATRFVWWPTSHV
jgi:ATP-binding cassette, subfamily C (CFTR/MRP), member 1